MTLAMALNTILILGVIVMVVSPLAWAIRTAHRDVPTATATPRLEPGAPLARRSERPAHAQTTKPRFGAVRPGVSAPAR